jgi:hypothetical protein
MGAPTLLGGATFEVDERSIVPVEERASFWRRHPNPGAFAILSAVVPELRRAGYKTMEVRRGKPDDVRCRCTVGSHDVELILVAEEGSGTTRPFFLMAWLSVVQVLGQSLTEEQARGWQQVSAITGRVIRDRFGGTSVSWLSPSDVDARFASRRDVQWGTSGVE